MSRGNRRVKSIRQASKDHSPAVREQWTVGCARTHSQDLPESVETEDARKSTEATSIYRLHTTLNREGYAHQRMGIGNEDTHSERSDLLGCQDIYDESRAICGQWDYFGVFDGHGGGAASKFCCMKMPERLAAAVGAVVGSSTDGHVEVSLIRDGLSLAFEEVEDEFVKWAESDGDNSGACALVVVCNDIDMYIANAGDCGGVLFTIEEVPKGEIRDADAIIARNIKAKPINQRHKCSNKNEEKRIYKSGGLVINGRVNGVLEPTRAIGDIDMKGNEPTGVIATPEVHHIGLDPSVPWVLVMGTDGLFDFLTIREIQNELKGPLRTQREVQSLVTELYEGVLNADGDDDVTIIVVASNPVQ
eukprot:CFRG0020T1